jgi:hypothetical protein
MQKSICPIKTGNDEVAEYDTKRYNVSNTMQGEIMQDEVELINKIKDELQIDFGWALYEHGLVLKADALKTIVNALTNKETKQ